ncbi:DUF2786 domain-containing protein [Streptomyces scopuliridis]|uniref:DUF2786 domain-containing protein n=1 Tax=Streptomyces scopuliridis TaxID=452529 RepID=A0ACD4ZNE2_9ACTN|nr:DUF2786 domain-containing protein [Streptomyces scopuliridis]WSB98626.1 DUF2786 domain-containing protein [Streptomyces scopuliridis]WSC07671.1 DUF2786 domain-containing protein [Streptomyces scopuliridis]
MTDKDTAGAAARTVERALAAVLSARAGDAGSAEGIDTGASLLAADPAADAELRRRGEQFVRLAWERGWGPADVGRLVRRDLDGPHLRLLAELIAAEARRYESLPPRWAAQLADLDAEREARPYRADRFSYATSVLELYLLLVRLPAIEPVGPVPGTPVHLTAPADGEPRMLTRIRALLAKAEATGYPQEAEALTAKAQELMARHSIDEALLADRTHRGDVPGACRIGVDAPYETAKAILLDAVASANRCRAVWNSAYGFSTVVGFEPDLEAVELLHTSLLVQGTAAMTRAEAAQRAAGRKRTKTFRQSFLLAYAHRIGERLTLATEQVTAEQVTAEQETATRAAEEGVGGLLPVLAAREVAVADRTDRMFPETVATRVRGATDAEGWTHGTSAADAARVPGGRGAADGPGGTDRRGRIRPAR